MLFMLKVDTQVPVYCCCMVNKKVVLQIYLSHLILSAVVGVIVVVAALVLVFDCYGNKADETDSCAAGF